MMNLTIEQIQEKLTAFCAIKSYIAFGYLFGSRAKNRITPLSDIDVALYIDTKKAPTDLFDLRLKELTALYQVFNTEKVDLVFLNETPLELSYNVLKNGILLYENDEQLRVRFFENTVRDYLDRKYFIDQR
ncbi:hypothetical protein GF337_06445, partial [candidate division KSB1 bacterium]|nr:hypothetical protein [candidate division KSB1 bacterium]